MQLMRDVRANIAVVQEGGESYTFNLGDICADSAVGVDRRYYEATTMLSRLYLLKPKANSLYYSEKLRLTREFKKADPESLGFGKKPTATDLTTWLQGQPIYQNLREVRDFIEDAITGLTTAFIPRLRSLAESSNVGVRETTGAKPPQDPFPPVPVQNTGPMGGAR